MTRVYNFAAGPAALPESVLETARNELLDWHGLGMSVMEISHRGDAFKRMAEESEKDFRDLLHIPDHYHVLFLQGGARLQFSAIPMNLLGGAKTAAYLDTGIWSQQAIEEAKRFCDVHIAASAKDSTYTTVPDEKTWEIPSNSAYFYYVDNETVNGIEFPSIPKTEALLVSDMASNVLSRPFDVSRYGLFFACAQKNIGPAGLTLVVVREDLLKCKSWPSMPSMLRYDVHAKEHSLWNTPPTFAWYLSGLVFKWLKKQGGVEAIAKVNQKKAEKLYHFIDQSDFYHNPIDARYRSRMNVIFTLADEKLNSLFLKETTENGLANLKGHRLLGGMRASIYNAMPEAGVDALIAFMKEFEKKFG